MGSIVHTFVGSVVLAQGTSSTAPSSSDLDNVKTIFDIIGTLVTAAALIVGGYWAYFRFVKERTYRPRLEVTMRAQWRQVNLHRLLHARIRVKNIGASNVILLQEGTGLRVSRVDSAMPVPPAPVGWAPLSVFPIFKEHHWIEPGETISEDLVLALPVESNEPVLFEARLVWQWHGGDDNITVFARQAMPADSMLE